LVLLAGWIGAFGWATGRLAAQRDRPLRLWTVLGAVFGPAALVVLREIPPGRCGTCRAPVSGWQMTCRWCGNDVRGWVRGGEAARSAPPAPVVPPATRTPAAYPAIAARTGAAEASVAPDPAATADRVAQAPGIEPTRSSRRGGQRPVPPASEDWDRPEAVIVTAPDQAARHAPEAPAASVASPSAFASSSPSASERLRVSGVYVTGSLGLSVGSRYLIQVVGSNLRVLGPLDRNPETLAVERPLADMDATAHDGRLIISQVSRGKADLVLVFMSVGGRTAEAVATEIVQAVRAAEVVRA
jgi:hypothetical protein